MPPGNPLYRQLRTLYERLRNPESRRLWILAALSVFILVVIVYSLFLKAPDDFPVPTVVTIPDSASLSGIAARLQAAHVIRSPFWFRSFVILYGGERSPKAGDYLFKSRSSVSGIAYRIANGLFGLTPVKVVLPEGTSVAQMAVILKNDLSAFDDAAFIRLATTSEGYLFPDTYLFLPNAKPVEVVSTLKNTFEKRVSAIKAQIESFGKPQAQVINMASILEEEGRTTETRRTIAGILWKRFALGMPLQVDSPFEYIIGKNTFELTDADLKINSPYNTYIHKGFPPTPITNPGLDSILAAVTPTKSPYFYYLSDVRGNMHYAVTFAEHQKNKALYLR